MDTLIIMLKNVIIFVLLAIPGYLLVKGKLLKQTESGAMSKLLTNIGMPFMILSSTMKLELSGDFTKSMILMAVLGSVFVVLMFITSAWLVSRDSDSKRASMMRFCMVFANNGFIGIPLARAVFGEGSTIMAFLIVLNIINNVLMFFGAEPINWINAQSSYAANIAVMTIYIVWNALPFKILILLGGLQSINKQYYDAARVDGTPRWRVLTRITVPLLSPMLAYVIITSFIGGFKEYSSIVGIFGEDMGPVGAPLKLNTMVGYIYEALPDMNYGVASAAALILFGIILVVTMINLQVSKKRVHF